jgi:hypothetical protein
MFEYVQKNSTYLLILLLLGITISQAIGQTMITEVDLRSKANINDSEYVCDELSLGDHGYIFKTASPQTSRPQTITIYNYGADLSLKWKKTLESSFYYPGNQFDRIISSNDGSVVYDIQIGKKQNFANRIFDSGDLKTKDLSDYGLTQNLQSVFCDTDNLYYLTTINGDEKEYDKRAEEKLILHSFSNGNFTYTRHSLQLPKIENGPNCSYWSYLGESEGLKFIASKNIDFETKKNYVMVAGFDASGTVQRNFKIEFSYPDHDLSHSIMARKGQTIFNVIDLDHTTVGSPSHGTSIFDHKSSYCTVYLDRYHNGLYLLGEIESQKKEFFFFIQKYSMTGELMWKEIYPADGIGRFAFYLLPDESSNFLYLTRSDLVIHEISNKGGQLSKQTLGCDAGSYALIKEGKFITAIHAGKLTNSFLMIKEMPDKAREMNLFSNYVSPSGEILLISDRRGKLKIIRFK